MDHSVHNKIVSFIWSIADDCLRDVYVRGKYRDVILPMFVLRRLDCLLEPTKEAVMEEVRFQRDDAGFTDLDPEGLREASGFVFYNTSPWTLKKLVDTAANNRQILEANFKAYLDGFSENVKEIVDKFKLRAQVSHMAEKDVLLEVLEKFTSPYINLTPNEMRDPDGRKLPPLTNLGMGYVFEELIRKFNEENNEEAGEHFTPREVIDLMTHILFEPVKDSLPPVITVYDPACGSGGMLTEAQDFITDPEGLIRSNAMINLYGKEINDETYAICKSDMMIKGNNPENIRCGSTLANDEFAGLRFDFSLSNPPYGKSWAGDQKYILDGKDVLDRRFEVPLKDFRGKLDTVPATPRSSDGQLLFLMEMVNKMKDLDKGPAGSRIASVHNGSSLFTGDAGGGESNIRRFIIENDFLEAIIQLPNNLFYNTGITTYIWVLSNKKTEKRRGKVQLIDASQKFRKLRKNLGAKNCEFAPEHIREITQLYLDMPHEGVSKVFDNNDFGYYKVTIERPSRKAAQFTPERIATLRFVPALREVMEWAYEKWGDEVYTRLSDHRKTIEAHLEKEEINLSAKQSKALFDPATWDYQKALLDVAEAAMAEVGQGLFMDFNRFTELVDAALKAHQVKLTASERNQLFNAVSWYDEKAERVVKKVHKLSGKKLDELLAELGCTQEQLADFGYWPTRTKGEYVEYESDSELRDTENVPLKDEIHCYFLREVRPHVDEAWINIDQTKIGYEISFNKYFYQHKPLRSLEEVTRDILALEAETEGLLKKLVSFGGGQ
ncbi:class I SAM-dependent DNA methyltransferase [Geobacter sulfurreducens subsp. ethanolicus]|uniref:type I restriction-modification system subunit M n=1 Tax=Geobacter sulfurreducens TaxID=35554 RepID=UPI002573F82D|nr:class I SAM-dependent DNA methyltransferase [Geobacter sulfurreducens]BEH09867.1 class I SAM-dependent DNA methyltransferase [Geobacter sulfurreducens subsp. ethanolicus]